MGIRLQYANLYECPQHYSTHCDFLRVCTLLEMCSIPINMAMFAITIYALRKATFHYNLVRIAIILLAGYYTLMCGRLVTCVFEIGLIRIHGNAEHSMVLQICSYLQLFYFGVACSIGTACAMERCFATVYVFDYELKKRTWVIYLVFGTTIMPCVPIAFLILIDVLPIPMMALVGMATSFSSFFVSLRNVAIDSINYGNTCANTATQSYTHKSHFRFQLFNILYFINKEKLRRVQCVNTIYSLSVRFQLNENLVTMKLLRNVVVISTTFNIIMATMLVGFIDDDFRASHPLTALYLHALFDFFSFLYGLFIILTILLSVKKYRLYFFGNRLVRSALAPILGRWFGEELGRPRKNVVQRMSIQAETEVYFAKLNGQWNIGIP
ncbi:unnamed protein product [Caenorhabditis bovis]|uniref:G protein-coupled receptor n=1 Tax=Caenorhabditis bovis TaxID=2654633 RepID=A0A8S1EVI7_9PELO|nr:unnamed protein product [Caenorhabditis bovis]